MHIGTKYLGNDTCEFIVWAPLLNSCTLKVLGKFPRNLPLEKDENGYFRGTFEEIPPGSRYFYQINEKEFPDPATNYQPEGVHGPSEVIDHNSYKWEYKLPGHSVEELIIYEMHLGTFTKEGTFRTAAEKAGYLRDLGITAVEIMPVFQFSGNRNWGYDGVNPFAPQNSYGRPEDMKYFIDQCHKAEISVILDIVYNHFGPEGNYLRNFAPYFTSHYRTPWGDAVNFDAEYSDGVRNYFLQNALFWLNTYHLDGLRLDAIDHIYDLGAKHFLAELNETIGKHTSAIQKKIIIAESDLNDPKVIRPLDEFGYGFDAQWSDDFHHSIHSLLTGEKNGYYMDFGKTSHLIKAINESFVFDGMYSTYRKRRHGSSAWGRPGSQFIICLQNHDQVGNRAFGKRLTRLVSYEALKLAAGALLLSPCIPLIFMGEEYGELNPFLYFISHEDSDLVEAVRKGRREEFSSFKWEGEIPDPFSIDTFDRSKLNWERLQKPENLTLLKLYKELINLRKRKEALMTFDRGSFDVSGDEETKTIQVQRRSGNDLLVVLFNFNKEAVTRLFNFPEGKWKKIVDSADEKWLGPGTSSAETLLGYQQNITLKGLSFSVYEE